MPSTPEHLTLAEVARLIGARLVGNGEVAVRGVAGIREAGPDQVTFLANSRYAGDLWRSGAAAVILAEEAEGLPIAQLVVADPYFAYARLMRTLHEKPRVARGVSADARLAPSVAVGEAPDIAAFVTVGEGTRLGDRVSLSAGVRIGAGCTIGDDVIIHENCVIRDGCRVGNRVIIQAGAVVGSDGFGYATHQGVHHKIPHVGTVVIHDDVEIGAGTTIDRGAHGDTVIGAGTKIDNLVQIAHNVQIGRHCLIVSQVGISGSTRIGDYVVLAGQAGVVGHLAIGNRVTVAAKSGVTKDVEDGETVSGYPAAQHREQLKVQAMIGRLPELRQRIASLETMIKNLNR